MNHNLSLPPNRKSKAQAMVEFALVLPILLLLIYGMMETGRLLFIYASTVTAARQAARYGAATGLNPNTSPAVPYYQDCAGIITAANRVGVLNRFDIDATDIVYDGGVEDNDGDGVFNILPVRQPPGGNNNPTCGGFSTAQNGDRITVTVQTRWEPAVPLVPLDGFDIISTSSRTILAGVDIQVTNVAPTFSGTGAHANITVTPSSATYTTAGQLITFNYLIESDGSTTMLGAFTLTDTDNKVTNITCTTDPPSMPVGATMSCSAQRTITQADVDAGYFTHTITFISSNAPDATATTTIYAVQNASMTLVKSSSTPASATSLTYTYVLTNTGNVTIKSPDVNTTPSYSITDDKIGAICSGTANIAPGAQVTCTNLYTVTNADKAALQIVNIGTATARYNRYDVGTNSYTSTTFTATSNTVLVYTTPLSMNITYSPTALNAVGQSFTFTFRIYNNTGGTAQNPEITVNSFTGTGVTAGNMQTLINNTNQTDGGDCPAVVNAGTFADCTYLYTITQTDIDNGQVVITARATSDNGTYSSNTVTRTVTITQTPQLNLSVAVSPGNLPNNPAKKDDPLTAALENEVTYTYSLQNTGNVTLTTIAVSDPTVTTVAITCSPTTLAPTASATCTGKRTITDDELDNNSFVTSTGTATGVFKGTTYSKTVTATVWTASGPRMKMTVTGAPSPILGEGVTVTFTYTILNTGNTTLSSPFTFTNIVAGSSTPTCPASVAPGLSITCTGTYVTKITDLTDAGISASNITVKSGTTTSNPPASVNIPFQMPTTCIIKHSILSTSSSGLGMNIRNDNLFGVRISSFVITYTDRVSPPHQFITGISVAGTKIWDNNNTNYDSPHTINSGFINTGSMLIPPNSTKALSISLKQNYSLGGTEQIIVFFSSPGCTDLRPDLDGTQGLDSKDSTQLQ